MVIEKTISADLLHIFPRKAQSFIKVSLRLSNVNHFKEGDLSLISLSAERALP